MHSLCRPWHTTTASFLHRRPSLINHDHIPLADSSQITSRRMAAPAAASLSPDSDDGAFDLDGIIVPSFQAIRVAPAQPTRAKPITMSLISKRCLTAQQTACKSAEEVGAVYSITMLK